MHGFDDQPQKKLELAFFNDLRALCRYNAFPNWESLWLFMIKSLEEDDVPPQMAALISN